MASATSDFETLLERLRMGDEDAAWQLVCEFGSHVVAVVRRRLRRQIRVRLDSQDLVQAVWKSFFLDMPGMTEIRSPDQLIRLLVEFTHQKLVDAYRRHLYAECRGAHREAPRVTARDAEDDSIDERGCQAPARDATPSQFAVAREEWQRMLKERPPVHQAVIRGRLTGETFASIAAGLGISERYARRIISNLWQQHCHDKA